MTAARSVSSSVEVAADPATAFAVFTEEVNCWWLQGPVNFYDSARAHGMRIEPGVGGRVVEVYNDTTGEGLELARITVWEPGARLAWESSLDDVQIDIRFTESDGGTVVRVQAVLPESGVDRGGTSWVRMTPPCLGAWSAKRDRRPREPARLARLAVSVHYARPVTAARWLRDVFGFEPASNVPEADTDDEETWIEFRVGDSALMVFKRAAVDAENAPVTHTPWVFVDDLDAHYAHAKDNGARIPQGIWQHGARAYDAVDLEGNRWTFAQSGPLMRERRPSPDGT